MGVPSHHTYTLDRGALQPDSGTIHFQQCLCFSLRTEPEPFYARALRSRPSAAEQTYRRFNYLRDYVRSSDTVSSTGPARPPNRPPAMSPAPVPAIAVPDGPPLLSPPSCIGASPITAVLAWRRGTEQGAVVRGGRFEVPVDTMFFGFGFGIPTGNLSGGVFVAGDRRKKTKPSVSECIVPQRPYGVVSVGEKNGRNVLRIPPYILPNEASYYRWRFTPNLVKLLT